MRKAASLLAWALLFPLLPGCEIAGSEPPKTGGTLVADAPPERVTATTWDYKPAPGGESADAGMKDAVGGASGGGAGGDPGRRLFDGAGAAPDGSDAGPAPAGAAKGPKKKGPKYTAGPRKETLKVNEPPPPAADASEAPGGVKPAVKAPPPPPPRKPVPGMGPSAKADEISDAGAGDAAAALPPPPATDASGCPEGMARIGSGAGGYCIDRYEGGLVEVTGDGEKPWSPYASPSLSKKYKAVAGAGRVPQGYIGGDTAGAACAAAGKRLCKLSEWEKACRGPDNTTFPYGSAYELQRCNEHDEDKGYSSTILRVFPGQGDAPFNSNKMMNDPRINQLENGLAPSGKHAKCTNGYGVFDMVGNLHEWIDDPAGTFKGGYYVDTYRNGKGCAYKTTAHPMKYHDYSTGFRCCADAR